jgi:outer membrane receptor protein involved in Fe transport
MKTNKMWFKRNHLVQAVAFALATSTAISVNAQENENTSAEDEAEIAPAERITVVGSRIRQGGFDSPRPVDIIMSDTAVKQGIGDLGGLLRNSTIAAGSSQVTPASSTAFVQNGGEGAQTISLRGLGANRTLVLLNGRRAGPAGTRGGVSSFDFNTLPLSMVERVEILKDGASSVYGSDAVAGVINVITKKGDGGSVEANYSQPMESGGEDFRVNATYGATFDRGSFRATVDYRKQNELQKGDRDFYNCGEQFITDVDTGQRNDVIDPRTNSPWCTDLLWGHVWLYDYQSGDTDNVPPGAKAQFDYDGDLGNYLPPLATGEPGQINMPPGWFLVNYDRTSDGVTNADHPFQDGESFNPEIETVSVFVQGDYQISDSMEVYTEALFNRRESNANGYRQYWSYKYNENFFAGDELSAGWTGSQWLSPTAITDHSDSGQTVDYTRFVLGITGDITDEWYFDASFQTSRSDGDYYNDIIYDDAISDQNFATGSCVGQTTSVRGVPCVDVPWLDPNLLAGTVSPEVRNFLFGRDFGNTVYKQSTLEAFASGPVFDLPAGEVNAVVGVAYQKDEITDTPGEATLARNVWGSSAAGITTGEDKTSAVYAELQIPVLEDIFLVEYLDLDLSARYTDVDSFGDDTTFKVGLNYAMTEELRFRASRGTSFRSPALFELYLADQTSFLGQRTVDPCINWQTNLDNGSVTETVAANCAADGIPGDYVGGAISSTVVTGGGAGVLEAETSVSRTVGFVYTPDFADLSLSVDWFDIQISGEVTQLGATNIVARCYGSEFFGNDPLCDQFDRDPADLRITEVRDSFINIASQINKGIDVEFNYTMDVGAGTLNFYTQHTIQLESKRALFEDTVIDTNGEFGDPKRVANYTLTYELDDLAVNWNVNYIGAVSNVDSYFDRVGRTTGIYRGQEVGVTLRSDSVMYHNLSAIYNFTDLGLEVTAGIANVLDEEPPRVTTLNLGELNTQGNSAFYSQYDSLGRRFFINTSYTF